ncbi:MAG: hypothetical protein PHI12_12030 [Dehalococcoidales bacterium]|nr:hypothetical protein [Dehalococcoidales bacterium]
MDQITIEKESISELISALRKVPPKNLKIIHLANEIPIVNGDFNPFDLESRQKEIIDAVEEAKAYGARTLQVVELLAHIREED